jgi:hypothetical protein
MRTPRPPSATNHSAMTTPERSLTREDFTPASTVGKP